MYKNNVVLCLTSLLALAAVPAQAGEWFTDEASGCQAWNVAPQPNETIAWSGACKDGKASGQGTLRFFQKGSLTSATTCDFLDGKCNGVGTTTWANGDRYEGDFVNDKRTGKGIFVFANGDRYEGDFIDDERTGKGVLTSLSGDRNEGDFVNGKLTGKGIVVWSDGRRYEGGIVEGVPVGKGVHVWHTGDRYEGDFVDGKQQGKGVFVWANGDRYEGDFVNGKFDGTGILVWATGVRYEGGFVGGYPVGKAVLVGVDGERYEGNFQAANDAGGKRSFLKSCVHVTPQYPAAAGPFHRGDGLVTGQIKALGIVVNGVVQSVQILSGPQLFHDVVRAAMLQYKCPESAGPVMIFQEFNFVTP